MNPFILVAGSYLHKTNNGIIDPVNIPLETGLVFIQNLPPKNRFGTSLANSYKVSATHSGIGHPDNTFDISLIANTGAGVTLTTPVNFAVKFKPIKAGFINYAITPSLDLIGYCYIKVNNINQVIVNPGDYPYGQLINSVASGDQIIFGVIGSGSRPLTNSGVFSLVDNVWSL